MTPTGPNIPSNNPVAYKELGDEDRKDDSKTEKKTKIEVSSGASIFVGRRGIPRTTTDNTKEPRGKSSSPLREKKVRIKVRGREEKSSYAAKYTPRAHSEERVNMRPSEDSRAVDKQRLLKNLGDAELSGQVQSAGMEAGRQESDTLADMLDFLSAQSQWVLENERDQAKFGIPDVRRQLKEKDNPCVQAGSLVCGTVADELASELVRLGVDLNKNALADQARKLPVEEPMKDDGWVRQWTGRPLHLTVDQAKGLLTAAQHIGEKVGKSFLESKVDPLDCLKNSFRTEGEQKASDESLMVKFIAKAYIRIAQRVAMKMAQSLMLELRAFQHAITNKQQKSKSLRTARVKIRQVQRSVLQSESPPPENPDNISKATAKKKPRSASLRETKTTHVRKPVPSMFYVPPLQLHGLIQPADLRGPRITVQSESTESNQGATMTSPSNPDNRNT